MIKNISIENFRQFKKLDIDDFGVMNIFLGDNNVGKTSVLEALALSHCVKNSSEDLFNIVTYRNLAMPTLGNDISFRTFFKDLNLDNPIKIHFNDNEINKFFEILPITDLSQRDKTLEFYYDAPLQYLSLKAPDSTSILGFTTRFYEENAVITDYLRLFINEGMIRLGHKNMVDTKDHFTEKYFFINSRRNESLDETFKVINDLKEDKEAKREFINFLKPFAPNIQDIHDMNKGSKYTALDVGLKRLIPANVMGDGFNRILFFLTGLFTLNTSTIYIDDMDSGLHYDAMVDVWKGLLTIEKTKKFQLFCTTHSAEMLEAAVEAFADAPEKLRIYRLERHGEETIAKKFDYKLAKDSLEFGSELRGVRRRG